MPEGRRVKGIDPGGNNSGWQGGLCRALKQMLAIIVLAKTKKLEVKRSSAAPIHQVKGCSNNRGRSSARQVKCGCASFKYFACHVLDTLLPDVVMLKSKAIGFDARR